MHSTIILPRLATLLALVLSYGAATASMAEQPAPTWLRGKSKNLEMRIQGEVITPDDQAAKNPTVTATLRGRNGSRPIAVTVKDNRFDVSLPIHLTDWYSIRIEALSQDTRHRASHVAMQYSIRQLAVDGLKLPLQPSTRTVTAKLVHDGSPVVGANLKVTTSEGSELILKSDTDGVVEVNLLPNERIDQFTAWNSQPIHTPLIGGFQFSREPVRDPEAESHTIEMHRCRDQVLRIVDGNGRPCENVVMQLQVATPSPNVNYLGQVDGSILTTDKKGEAVFRWFPDWSEVHCYVDIQSDGWVIDGKGKWIDGDFVTPVKPRKKRQTVVGKLQAKDVSPGGFAVYWRSFQGERENHSDMITSFTDQDGNFSADVLPGASYCVFVNDTHHVSDMVDLIPAPMDVASTADAPNNEAPKDEAPVINQPATKALINLIDAEPLQITVTAGPKKRPLANQSVYVRQTHDYQWMEDGRQKSGASARDRYVKTDDQGRVTALVQPGKEVEVSIYNPDWRTSKEAPIVAGEKNTITLHREVDEPRTVLGIIVQSPNTPIPLSELTVTAGSVDGETRGSEQVALRENGVFAYPTQALAVSVIAMSKDRTMAGVVVAENPRRLLRLKLQPTATLRGRLIDPDGKPVTDRTVNATVRLTFEPANKELNRFYGFDHDRHQVQTDADGYYTFDAMPCEVEIALSADSPTQSRNHWLGTTKLKPNQEHPVETDTIKN